MALEDSSVKDFGGGWNTSDSDQNLNSRFQPISDNIVRGIDGSFGPRQGMGLWCDFATGTATDLGNIAIAIGTVNGTAKVLVDLPVNHGLTGGNHITISGLTADVNGIPFAEINGTHSVVIVDPNSMSFHVRVNATSTATVSRAADIVLDNNLLGGNIIHEQYFSRKLIVFTDIGEIGTAADDGTALTRIWGPAEAFLISPSLVPTRRCEHWSTDTFKSTVIACNGYNRDKPLQIFDDFDVEYLVDKATSSNAAVPKADYVVCLQSYVTFIRTEYGDPFVEFSAKATDGTFTRDPSPADSAEVDLSMITASVEPVLLGAAPIRDKLYTAFYDKGMIGTLGVYDASNNHVPDFNDTIAENGTVSHRTMVSLGNDVIMCDYAGVPSVAISQQSGVYTPIRLSELIAPSIQAHLSRLSEDTLRSKSFAVFNRNDRSYMLFLPIYDEMVTAISPDPFLFNDELRALNYAAMTWKSHRLVENSWITIAGAVDIGSLTAANINGLRHVVSIIDKDTVIVELGGAPTSADDTFGGGGSVTIEPVNNETIGYVFEYNKEFKIRRWTRYRGWDFDCGTSSQRGKVFFAKRLKVYRMGDNEIPLYADFLGFYDIKTWDATVAYDVGTRVLDVPSDTVYIVQESYIAPMTGTFAAFRDSNLDIYAEYQGEPINWALETPWSDMRTRGKNKIIKYINVTSEGTGRFTVSAFVNNLRNNPSTNEISPYRSLEFQAGDTGGWNQKAATTWGSGRRTREQKLWPMGIRGKVVRWGFYGSTTERVKITALTMYYMLGNFR